MTNRSRPKMSRNEGAVIDRVNSAVVVGVLLAMLGLSWSSPAVAQEDSIFDTISGWFGSSSRSAEPVDYGGVSASDVFRATQDLMSEIDILRDELGVYDFPPEAELPIDRMPVHAYAKSLEVLQKVLRVQSRMGVPMGAHRQMPFKEIVPADVLSNVEYIMGEVLKIKRQMVIEREIEPAPLVAGMTPSMVYQSLANASFMLDGLQGRPLTPSDVFDNCVRILDEMELIAPALRASIDLDFPEIEGRKRPKDVAQQVLRATYKVINLQTKLGMDASGVPNITLVRVTPSEVFDATNMLLAELSRIKLHLDIDVPRNQRPEAKGRTSNDVFAVVLIIIRNLDRMSRAA